MSLDPRSPTKITIKKYSLVAQIFRQEKGIESPPWLLWPRRSRRCSPLPSSCRTSCCLCRSSWRDLKNIYLSLFFTQQNARPHSSASSDQLRSAHKTIRRTDRRALPRPPGWRALNRPRSSKMPLPLPAHPREAPRWEKSVKALETKC